MEVQVQYSLSYRGIELGFNEVLVNSECANRRRCWSGQRETAQRRKETGLFIAADDANNLASFGPKNC